MRRAFLTISCFAAFVAPFILLQDSTYADEPYHINLNEQRRFPTWHAGVSTKFCARNLGNTPGKAHIQVEVAFGLGPSEDVDVGSNDTTCIDRNWAGSELNVTNVGQTP